MGYAYDAYLMVMYLVDKRCRTALDRNGLDWRAHNVCPPCTYALDGKPNLKYSLLCAIDGNSSLKLVGEKYRHGTALQDERTQRMDVWVTEKEVNEFKD